MTLVSEREGLQAQHWLSWMQTDQNGTAAAAPANGQQEDTDGHPSNPTCVRLFKTKPPTPHLDGIILDTRQWQKTVDNLQLLYHNGPSSFSQAL